MRFFMGREALHRKMEMLREARSHLVSMFGMGTEKKVSLDALKKELLKVGVPFSEVSGLNLTKARLIEHRLSTEIQALEGRLGYYD